MRTRELMLRRPDDGLGGSSGAGTAVPAGDVDPILEQPGYVTDAEEFPRDPALNAEPAAADPFAGFSAEVRAEADKKGWTDPSQMFQSYQEAQGLVGRRDAERERLAADNAQLIAALQNAQGGGDGSGGGPAADPADPGSWSVDFEKLEQAAGGDPAEMMKLYHENVVPQLLEDFGKHILSAADRSIAARVEPVQDFVGKQTLRQQASDLAAQFPADFPKHADEIVALVQSRPEYRQSQTGLKQAFFEILATERAREQAVNRGNEGELLQGGRGPGGTGARRPVRDVGADVRAAIEGATMTLNDGLS